MFGKRSNVTNQIKLKEEMLKEVNALLYKLERGQYNKGLSKESTKSIIKEIRMAYDKVSNSIGTGDEDISLGANKIKADLELLLRASQGNLDARFEDCALSLIEDMEEIVDLENGIIAEIPTEVDKASKKQRYFNRKLLTIENFGQEFIKNRNRVEEEIAKIEKDKKELDSKLLNEPNARLKQNIFRQIKVSLNKIAALSLKSSEYSSCSNLLDTIKIYAKELVELGDLSSEGLDKAKIILNINRIKNVLDNPNKLKSLLKVIELDLKKSQKNIEVRDTEIFDGLDMGEEKYDAMNEYQNELIKKDQEKEEISGGLSDLENYLKKLDNK